MFGLNSTRGTSPLHTQFPSRSFPSLYMRPIQLRPFNVYPSLRSIFLNNFASYESLWKFNLSVDSFVYLHHNLIISNRLKMPYRYSSPIIVISDSLLIAPRENRVAWTISFTGESVMQFTRVNSACTQPWNNPNTTERKDQMYSMKTWQTENIW